MLQNLSHYEKILSRSHSNYLAQINIEMTSASNETNDVLTKLTVSQIPLFLVARLILRYLAFSEYVHAFNYQSLHSFSI